MKSTNEIMTNIVLICVNWCLERPRSIVSIYETMKQLHCMPGKNMYRLFDMKNAAYLITIGITYDLIIMLCQRYEI